MMHFNEIMKHTNYGMAQRAMLLMLFIIFSNVAWASSTKDSGEYAQAIVTVDPDAAGKVYVDTSTIDIKIEDAKFKATVQSEVIQGKEFTVWFMGTIATYNDITFNLYAKQEDNGYIWAGWYEKESETLYSSDMTTTVTITAESTNDKKPTSMTYVAKWLQPKVTEVDRKTIDFGEINDPTAPIEAESVVYTIADYMGKDNYVMETVAPFTHTEADDPIDETKNQYTSTISYAPTGIHGEVSGDATLASTLYMNGTRYDDDHQQVTLSVKEDYTPIFKAQNTSAKNPYDFEVVAFGSSGESTTALHTIENNYAASVLSTTDNPKYGRATWTYTFDEFSLSGKSAKDYFSIKEGTGDAGKPTVVFNSGTDVSVYGLTAEAEGEVVVTVRMGIQCTYYDANNKPQTSSIQYSYLKVIVKKENTSVMEFNDGVSGDFGEVNMGEMPILDLGMYISYVDFEEVACDLSGDGAELFTVSSKPENGKVTVQISDQWENFSGCDEHIATLTVTGTRARPGKNGEEEGKTITATITISATLILGKDPELIAAGGNKVVTFTWNKIAGAKYYDFYYRIGNGTYNKVKIEAGIDVENLTSNETQYTYSVAHGNNGSNYVTYGYVVAKVDNDNSYTITNDYKISPETKCIRISPIKSAKPELAWILTTNAANSGIKTGIEGATKPSDIPNATYRDVNVSSAFDAGGNPIFDRLYIFGETNREKTSTHVYIYEKATEAENNGYKYVTDITNVQSTRDAKLTINAENYSSLYFTGYCANAGTGFKNNTKTGDGVIHVRGGSKTLNIYIDDLQVYAKDNGYTTTLTYDSVSSITLDDNNYYTRGKGSVFVFESTSVNEASPFIVKMHIRGDNVMDAAKGATYTIAVEKNSRNVLADNPQHYSSPICVLPVAKGGVNQRTSLVLDDVWPTGLHTNGLLTLLEKNDDSNAQGISIDLGNAGTTLAIEGGQYNFLPTAAAYRTTHYSVSGEGFSVMINAYGLIGNNPTTAVGTVTHTKPINAAKSIALNDGTFSAESAMKWYSQSLKVDGGSYNKEIEHYTDNNTKANAICNSDGKELYRAEVNYSDIYGSGSGNEKAEITNFAQMVEDLFPDAGVTSLTNEVINYHYPLSVYYVGDRFYGYKSLTLKDNKLYLMVPYMDCTSLSLPWQICSPNLVADVDGTEMPLGGSIEKFKGCPHHATTKYTVDRLLNMQLDSYSRDALDNYYLYGQNVKVKLRDELLYGTINDEDSYNVQKKIYMLMPIEAAKWMLFAAPFDVANVYVIESYPEKQLVADYEGKRGRVPEHRIGDAREAQAHRFLDLYTYWYQEEKGIGDPYDFFDSNSTTDMDGDGKPEPYGKFVLDWMAYETQNNMGNTEGNYMPIVEKLIHFTGKDGIYPEGKTWKNANYYIYQLKGDWTYANQHFTGMWDTVRVVADGTNAIMEKGKVYALNFPYNAIGGVHDPATTWDYWTGKYLLIESTEGPHTINGSQTVATTLSEQTVEDNTAILLGNASFASVKATLSGSTTLWALDKIARGEEGNETGRDIHEFVNKGNTALAPAEGFLLANFTPPTGMRARTINYKTGEVTYESIPENEDDSGISTDVPTIMGDITLVVIPTEEGLTIQPLKAQHVMLLDVAGHVLLNQYLSEEICVNLLTGVYIVRGEYEQVKVLKK